MALAMHIQTLQERRFSNSATDDELPKKHNEWPTGHLNRFGRYELNREEYGNHSKAPVHSECHHAERQTPDPPRSQYDYRPSTSVETQL
jgi:hypothetical protein